MKNVKWTLEGGLIGVFLVVLLILAVAFDFNFNKPVFDGEMITRFSVVVAFFGGILYLFYKIRKKVGKLISKLEQFLFKATEG